MPDPAFVAPTAADLFREVGLLPDGPLPWGRPVPERGRGVFIVELAAPRTTAPIELTRVGKWLERVPELRMDGERPGSRALSARLARFWLPSQVVLYIGATTGSIGARVGAMERTVLGERRPSSAGHWLHTLSVLDTARVWWATTDAVEEYEDALLSAFVAAVPTPDRAGLPEGAEPLPFANLRRATGERRPTGLTGSLLPEPVAPPTPPRRIVDVPDGDAEGARGEPPAPRRRIVAQPAPEPIRRAPTPRAAALAAAAAERAAGTGAAAPPADRSAGHLTADGAARLRAELVELTTGRRPEVIARIRAAKELGDLKENADYTAAREEQSFLEGRIQALEARLREAVVVEAPVAGAAADLGSRVTVEVDGLTDTYTLVGSAEAAPGSGRLSVASPVGKALLGAIPGSEVRVTTPRGTVVYRVLVVE